MRTAERRAERRVDHLHHLACRMPPKTASWFLHQELKEAEDAHFQSGDPDDLAYVIRLEKSIVGASA